MTFNDRLKTDKEKNVKGRIEKEKIDRRDRTDRKDKKKERKEMIEKAVVRKKAGQKDKKWKCRMKPRKKKGRNRRK